MKRRSNNLGQIVGFELRAAKEWLQQNPNMTPIDDHCFIQTKNGRRTKNLQVFETFGKALLEEAKSRSGDIILLDEIGGIELLSKSFTDELFATIRQPRKIIGVFKSEANYRRQKRHTLEKVEIDQQRMQLKQEIIENDGQICLMTEDNVEESKKRLVEFLEK